MDSVHELSIASQRGNGLGGVAVDEARDVLLEGGETRSDAGIQDVKAAFEVLPQAFDRMQRGAGGGPPHEDDVLRHLDALGHMRWRLIQQDDGETLRIGLAKLVETETEALGIQGRQLPPEGLARGGLDRGLEPVRLVEGRDNLDGLHAITRQPTLEGQGQAQPRFILAADPPGLRRCLAA
jgi:hypothetical protein